MKTEKLPVLIVGAGLAGICIADQLHKNNISFKVIDNGENHSSSVAAGIINPLVFRRTTKSWRLDEFLPTAFSFFEEKSKEWGRPYFIPVPIRRAFSHQQEQDEWLKKQDDPEFAAYMEPFENGESPSYIRDICGSSRVKQSGYVDTQAFLADAHNWLRSIHAFVEADFDYDLLDPETCIYANNKYAHVIFCQGYQSIYNPWFSYLPLDPTKGELLTVTSDELPAHESINRKCFLMPVGAQKFKLGATYTWKTANTILTEEAKEKLTEDLKNLTLATFDVIEHKAGVRPTVVDRRPLMGRHPMYKQLSIFNGLGAKGFMMAPLLAQEFYRYLYDNILLDNTIDITRFKN